MAENGINAQGSLDDICDFASNQKKECQNKKDVEENKGLGQNNVNLFNNQVVLGKF